MTKGSCKGRCRFITGVSNSSPRYVDGTKYCSKCQQVYVEELFSKFRVPSQCECCGSRLRVRPRSYGKRWLNHREDTRRNIDDTYQPLPIPLEIRN